MQTRAKLWSVWALALIGCPAGGQDDTSAGETATASETTDPGETTSEPTTGEPAGGCEQVPVTCVDAAIQDLSLQEKVSEGVVASTRDGDDWLTKLDASAGGTMNAAMNAWLYLRFTDDGLAKVEIDDIAALTSSDWDIAAKRYGIRVNSGSSGPSCVTVAAGTGEYAALGAAPVDASFAAERYYTDDCALVPDDHTLGDPDYQMATWWAYEGCVKTTGSPFVLRLADERALKLVVEAYYGEGQAACNESNAMGTDSAQMTWRWRFLP
jgi:hypothetical protein